MKMPDAKAAVDKEWKKLEKLPAWQMTQVKNETEVMKEAQKERKTVHLTTLMDICNLKNVELEPKYQMYKGRLVLRGEIVRNDSGSYAVFTEQGSSASQITAAKAIEASARLPGCTGQAADAASAKTKVQMEDASSLLKLGFPLFNYSSILHCIVSFSTRHAERGVSASRSFTEKSSLQHVRIGESSDAQTKYFGPEPLLRHANECYWVGWMNPVFYSVVTDCRHFRQRDGLPCRW